MSATLIQLGTFTNTIVGRFHSVSQDVLQPAKFDAGPRIGKVETVTAPNGFVNRVEHWFHNNGNLAFIR